MSVIHGKIAFTSNRKGNFAICTLEPGWNRGISYHGFFIFGSISTLVPGWYENCSHLRPWWHWKYFVYALPSYLLFQCLWFGFFRHRTFAAD